MCIRDRARGLQLDLVAVYGELCRLRGQDVLDPVGARPVQRDEQVAIGQAVSVEGSPVGLPRRSAGVDQDRPGALAHLYGVEYPLVDVGQPAWHRHRVSSLLGDAIVTAARPTASGIPQMLWCEA